MYIGNVMLLVLNLPLVGLFAQLLKTPPAMLYSGVIAFSVLGAYALNFAMMRRVPASTATALQLLAPPLAAVFGWALLGERLYLSDILGGVLTLGGLALLLRARARGA